MLTRLNRPCVQFGSAILCLDSTVELPWMARHASLVVARPHGTISNPGSFYALPLLVFVVGPPSCTVVDFGPSSAGCRLTAPGAGGVVCCGPPPGVPCAAPSVRALPASAPALPPVLSILDGNSSCVVVWFPDGPAAAPAAEFAVCGRPPWPMVSASAGFCDALRLRPGSLVPFSPFTKVRNRYCQLHET